MDKTAEYLRLLQEKNRLKRAQSTKSKDEQVKEELEKGFTTHFRGAHASKEAKVPVPVKIAAVKPLNILGRLAQGANNMWNRGDFAMPSANVGDDHGDDHRSPVAEMHDEGGYSEYESDFDEVSDTELDHYRGRDNRDASRANAVHNQLQPVHEELDDDHDVSVDASAGVGYKQQAVLSNVDSALSPQLNVSHNAASGGAHRQEEPARESLDSSLQTRVKDLSVEQKLKLLKLLEQDVGEPQQVGQHSHSGHKPLHHEYEHEQHHQDEYSRKCSGAAASQDIAITTPVRKSIRTGDAHSPSHAVLFSPPKPLTHVSPKHRDARPPGEGFAGRFEAQAPQAAVAIGHGANPSQDAVPVTFRIRILSSWSPRAKFVSLGAVRLRGIDSNGNKIDLLQHLTLKASSGLLPLPAASECVRTLSVLTGVSGSSSRRPLSAYRGSSSGAPQQAWKGPLSPDSPLELFFEGLLPVGDVSSDDFMNTIELQVWNCPSAPLSSAPAKDLDVFVGSRCVWSGQLDAEPADSAGPGLGGEPAASLTVHPWRLTHSSAAPPAASAAAPMSTVPQNIKHSIPHTHSKAEEVANRVEENGVPAWLRLQEKPAARGRNVLGGAADSSAYDSPARPASKSRKGGRRRDGSGTADDTNVRSPGSIRTSEDQLLDRPAMASPAKVPAATKRISRAAAGAVHSVTEAGSAALEEEEVVDHSTHQETATAGDEATSSLARRRAARRDRHNVIKDLHKPSGPSDLALHGGFSPERSGASKREREAELKRSIDSMQFNDKFNLGRLSASKLPLLREASHGSAEEDLAEEEPADAVLETLYAEGQLEESASAHPFADDSLDNRPVTPEATGIARAANTKDRHGESAAASLSPARKVSLAAAASNSNNTSYSSLSKAAKDTDRTARIELVQEKIQSTLSGLAQMMSNLPTERQLVKAASKAELLRSDAVPNALSRAGCTVFTLGILSNWGDAHYVGLNGIELYDQAGALLQLGAGIRSIEAFPRDLSELPEHSDDPRKVQNLLNGLNFTRNDLHSWLAPHSQVVVPRHNDGGSANRAAAKVPHLAEVTVTFERPVHLSMCRIFNYNKSRTRNQRGVRRCTFSLDGHVVLDMEIARATGQLHSVESESQVVFFDASLSAAEQARLKGHLVRAQLQGQGVGGADGLLLEEAGEESVDLEQSWAEMSQARPRTSAGLPPATDADTAATAASMQRVANAATGRTDDIPSHDFATSPSGGHKEKHSHEDPDGEVAGRNNAVLPSRKVPSPVRDRELSLVEQLTREMEDINQHSTAPAAHRSTPAAAAEPVSHSSIPSTGTIVGVTCRVVRLYLDTTWGDASYVGLAGLEVLVGQRCVPTKLTVQQLSAKPKDLSEIGCFDDPRKLCNLLNGLNDTADDTHMWLVPYTKGSDHYVEINLQREFEVVGLRIWNYNKPGEQVLRGCRQMRVTADGQHLFQCLLRQGPACDGVRFGQTILFSDICDILQGKQKGFAGPSKLRPGQQREARLASYITPQVRQDFEAPLNPTGMLWKFTFFDNWNDGYYIGLDAIEFYDEQGRLIDVGALGSQVQAVPFSVQDLSPALAADPRTPAQLFAPLAQREAAPDGTSCWLSPLARCMTPLERAACVRRVSKGGATGGYDTTQTAPSFPLNNVLFVFFQQPVTVAAIRIYNYSKTASRGAKDFLLEVDGLYLHMGTLLRADREKIVPGTHHTNGKARSRGQSVLFTNDPRILQTHKEMVSYCGAAEQDLLCINERQVMVRSKTMYDQEPPNTSLEGVRADLDKRPMTAAFPPGRA